MTSTSEPTPDLPDPLADPLPEAGVLLGLDYGRKRVGVAVSTVEQNLALPLENWNLAGDEQADARHLRQLIEDQQAVGLIVGLPLHSDGTISTLSQEAQRFGTWASEATGLPVSYWDERYTTQQAEAVLLEANMTRKKRKARRDMLAARIILQGYLDRLS